VNRVDNLASKLESGRQQQLRRRGCVRLNCDTLRIADESWCCGMEIEGVIGQVADHESSLRIGGEPSRRPNSGASDRDDTFHRDPAFQGDQLTFNLAPRFSDVGCGIGVRSGVRCRNNLFTARPLRPGRWVRSLEHTEHSDGDCARTEERHDRVES
jgi:hypothetical protein